MVKVKVQKQQLKVTMGKIQNQYNQIMERARENQDGIRKLCEGWQNPNAKTQILNLVNILNEKMEKITRRYAILFDKLNGWAGETVRSGGGNWTNIPFEARPYTFSASEVKDGNNGENVVFDENLIFDGIGQVSRMSKNIIKNQMDTSRIFNNNNECFGIMNDSPAVFENFKMKMEQFANEINEEVNQCIASFNLVSDEQRNKLNIIMQKYSVGSLSDSGSSGWTNSVNDNIITSNNSRSTSVKSNDIENGISGWDLDN